MCALVTGVQTCALPISRHCRGKRSAGRCVASRQGLKSVGVSGAAWPNLKAAFVSPRRPHRRKRTHLIARASQSLFKERAPMTEPFDPSGPDHLSAADRADRKSVGKGERGSRGVDVGGCRIIKNTKKR